MSTSCCSRREIGPLLQELEVACRRPLFTEICLDDAARKEAYQAKHEAMEQTILAEAASRHESIDSDSVDMKDDKEEVTATVAKKPSLTATKENAAPATSGRKRSWREVCLQCHSLSSSCAFCLSSQLFYPF